MPGTRDDYVLRLTMTRSCDLCGLDVGTQPFALRHAGQELQFCCEGCRGIYRMLNQINDGPAAGTDNPAREPERSKP